MLLVTWVTWTQHIKNVKGECMKSMNILRTLSHHHWGCDEEILLRIYRSVIRSKLEYGNILYSTSCRTNMNLLNTVPNTAFRIILGAFRSSPSESLHVEAQEMPLNLRRQKTLLSYALKVFAMPNHPAHDPMKTSKYPTTIKPMTLLSIPQMVQQHSESINLNSLVPMFYSKHAPWSRHQPMLNTVLHRYNKQETHGAILKQHFLELKTKEKFDEEFYTDASKDEHGVACSIVNEHNNTVSYKLPPTSSIHTGELFAIYKSLFSTMTPGQHIAIFTDSLSSIQSISNIYSNNPLIQKIQERCHIVKTNKNISTTIIWIPSHVGIEGNEVADQSAKLALSSDLPITNFQLHSDLKATIKLKSLRDWQTKWNSSNNKLHAIQPEIDSPLKISLNRKDKIVIRRLRIAHTRLTHGYLMSSEEHPICEYCRETRLTVEHLLSRCPHYDEIRRRMGLKENLKDNLNSATQIEATLKFLKECQLYNHI
ncbi:uncharacterized protein LOC123322337 [Coccinella septempunctata]|uniref:uncharacterized protein LOC123322337 n=1 Tax=Coccinella septempunctata TaxID=41139 RepID=UPI001D084B96|nr:uncharacterized protein LOC123322337 [Coccinella septempunctata]